jgi:hypothetical protein
MNRYSVYVHRHGNSISTTVDADTEAEAIAVGKARFMEVFPGLTPGLADASLLGPAPVRAPFVAVGMVLVDV